MVHAMQLVLRNQEMAIELFNRRHETEIEFFKKLFRLTGMQVSGGEIVRYRMTLVETDGPAKLILAGDANRVQAVYFNNREVRANGTQRTGDQTETKIREE